MRFKSFVLVVSALKSSWYALVNAGILILLFVFFYAILGMNLFAKIKISEPLDGIVNFQNFFNSFLILFRASTGENWHQIMIAISK
jgi:hypothetical protein